MHSCRLPRMPSPTRAATSCAEVRQKLNSLSVRVCYTLHDVESGACCSCGSSGCSPGLVPHAAFSCRFAGAIGEVCASYRVIMVRVSLLFLRFLSARTATPSWERMLALLMQDTQAVSALRWSGSVFSPLPHSVPCVLTCLRCRSLALATTDATCSLMRRKFFFITMRGLWIRKTNALSISVR